LTLDLLDTGAICIAYETIEKNGHFPLLAPMSEIAGRVAAIVGAYYLGINFGGEGLLISGLSGIPPGNVLILGAGVAARSAAQVASGLGARVTLMSPFIEELREIEMNNYFGPHVSTLFLSRHNILNELYKTDILISAVYVRGARTPILVTRDMIKKMKKGSVIVAIDIDQGSSIETARPTSHEDPIYTDEGIIHYCVTNMPGVFSKTSTIALTNLTLPYIKKIAKSSIKVFKEDPEIKTGLNLFKGRISYKKVAEDHNLENLYKEYK
jgi:alanine dehydrogenase